MKITHIITASLLGLCTALSGGAAAKAKPEADKAAPAKETEKKDSAYDKLFKDKKVKTAKGFLTLHLTEEGKLYLELPKSLLGKALMITSTIESTTDPGNGYAGQMSVPPYMTTFVRADSLLLMKEFAPVILSDDDPGMVQAIRRSNIDPIVGSYPIKAWTPDSCAMVIDVTSLLSGGNKKLLGVDRFGANAYGGWALNTAAYNAERSYMTDVFAIGETVSLESELSYDMTLSLLGILTMWKDKPTSVTARRTFTLLPEQTLAHRLGDDRLGVWTVPFERYSSLKQGAETDYVACRRGILSGNGKIKPVVFYIDTTFNAAYADAIRKGVEMWNDAFHKIGYENVVQAKMFPAGDTTFNAGSPFVSTVLNAATPEGSLTSRSWIDPRSGEILGSTIIVPFNIGPALQQRMMLEMSAVDPDARTTQPSEARIAAALTTLIAAKVGPALGVMPNYAASAAYPTDSLRSVSFTARNGLASSITDDVLYNIVARPGDKERGVKLMQDGLGPYDYFAVQWLYMPVEGAATAREEEPVLKKLLAEKSGDPVYFYNNPSAGSLDPRVETGDLGSDVFKSVANRTENLKYTVANAASWLEGKDPDYAYRSDLLSNAADKARQLLFALTGHIGGIYLTPRYEGDKTPSFAPVPKEVQRQALTLALQNLEELSWLDQKSLTKDIFGAVSVSGTLRNSGVKIITSRMRSLKSSDDKNLSPYTAEEMADDVIAYLTRELKNGKAISEYHKNFQKAIVEDMIDNANLSPEGGSVAELLRTMRGSGITDQTILDALGAANMQGTEISAEPAERMPDMEMTNVTMLGASEQAVNYSRVKYKTAAVNDHLFYGIVLRLKDIYTDAAKNAPNADTRNHARFLLSKIDKALKIG